MDAVSNDEVIAAFGQARVGDYRALAADAARVAKRIRAAGAGDNWRRQVTQIEDRLAKLDTIAFYPPKERETTTAAVSALLAAARPPSPPSEPKTGPRRSPRRYRHRTWVTRPRPGIDRLSSAWLIRRFIDPRARFAFSDTVPSPGPAVPFDMFGVEFGHVGPRCTFETLVDRFEIVDPAVTVIGEIVHDLDLKEHRFGRPESVAIGRLVEGLRARYGDDRELLSQGIMLFEALYRSLQQTGSLVRDSKRRRP